MRLGRRLRGSNARDALTGGAYSSSGGTVAPSLLMPSTRGRRLQHYTLVDQLEGRQLRLVVVRSDMRRAARISASHREEGSFSGLPRRHLQATHLHSHQHPVRHRSSVLLLSPQWYDRVQEQPRRCRRAVGEFGGGLGLRSWPFRCRASRSSGFLLQIS